jgi:hypothetical protein
MQFKNHPNRKLRHWLSFPFIWFMLFPVAILDFFMEIYHHICFPLYGIKLVKRNKYIKIDRHKLSRLTFMQKLNCMYCGYVNGVMAYGVKIAGETEKYWCGIKHDVENDKEYIQPEHHNKFERYGK